MSEEQPTNPPTIYEALASVMNEVGHLAKDSRNPQGGYNFRGIDAVVNTVSPVLRKHKVIVVPYVTRYDYGEILVGKNRTPMGHARVTVTYTFYGPRGDSIVCSTPGEAFDSGDKATPKAMSVAFRTALLQALCLPTDDVDPDAQTYQRADQRADHGPHYNPYEPGVDQSTGEVRMIDKGQLIELKTLEGKLGRGGPNETEEAREGRLVWYAWVAGRQGITSANDLTEKEAELVIGKLRERVAEAEANRIELSGDRDE